jgi:hypothetical protein
MNILITLTTAGANTGPTFLLYSNVDNFNSPFASGVTKAELLAGYYTSSAPNGTTTVRVQSVGLLCTNYVDLPVVLIPTTTTTTTVAPTTTTTTTIPGTTTTTTTALVFKSFTFNGGQGSLETACGITTFPATAFFIGAGTYPTVGDSLYFTANILDPLLFNDWMKMSNGYAIQGNNTNVIINIDSCGLPTTTTTTTVAPITTTTTTTGLPCYSCGQTTVSVSTLDLNQGMYPNRAICSTSDTCFLFNWNVLGRPNRFRVFDTSGEVWSSGWVGVADYSGPWGQSLNTVTNGTSPLLQFTSTEGRYVSIDYGAADPNNPSGDGAEWSLTCSPCPTTTTTTTLVYQSYDLFNCGTDVPADLRLPYNGNLDPGQIIMAYVGSTYYCYTIAGPTYVGGAQLTLAGDDYTSCPVCEAAKPVPTTTSTTTLAPITTTTTTTVVPITTTTTTLAPPVGCYSCGETTVSLSTSELSGGSYPAREICSTSSTCFVFNYNANDRPNIFRVLVGTNTIWSSGWVGFADYAGPWGPSLNIPPNGNSPLLQFTSTSDRSVIVDYGEANPSAPINDSAEWNLGCAACTTTTTTTAPPPRYRYLLYDVDPNVDCIGRNQRNAWSFQNVSDGFYTINGQPLFYLITSSHSDDTQQLVNIVGSSCTAPTTTTTTTAAVCNCFIYDITIGQADLDDATGNNDPGKNNGTVYLSYVDCAGTETVAQFGLATGFTRCINSLGTAPDIYYYKNDAKSAALSSSVSGTSTECCP